jgi:hypothetical protein
MTPINYHDTFDVGSHSFTPEHIVDNRVLWRWCYRASEECE